MPVRQAAMSEKGLLESRLDRSEHVQYALNAVHNLVEFLLFPFFLYFRNVFVLPTLAQALALAVLGAPGRESRGTDPWLGQLSDSALV